MGRPVGFVCTVQGDSFWRMFVALLRSMKANQPGLSCPIVVVYHTMPEDQKALIEEEYPRVEFHKLDYGRYKESMKHNVRFWLLEAFNPVLDLDRVITLGADMLCIRHMNELIYKSHGLISCWREPSGQWNSGAMVINKPLLTQETYDAVLAHQPNYKAVRGHDQAVINSMFAGQIKQLPANTQVVVDKGTNPEKCGATFLHFMHKPFARAEIAGRNSSASIALLKKHMGGVWWS